MAPTFLDNVTRQQAHHGKPLVGEAVFGECGREFGGGLGWYLSGATPAPAVLSTHECCDITMRLNTFLVGLMYADSEQLQRDVLAQWEELDLHLALDELTRDGMPVPESGHAGHSSRSHHHGMPSRTIVSTGSERSKAKRGPRPRLFKKNSCQADNCSENLSSYSFYYQRNHICPTHLKCTEYSVRGVAMRFCQRCGVGHAVEEFSGSKRSCKKALERHNQRRREKQGGGSMSGGSAAPGATTASGSQVVDAGPTEWEVNSRPSSIYASTQPWSLGPEMLNTLGMAAPEGIYLPALQGDLPRIAAGEPAPPGAPAPWNAPVPELISLDAQPPMPAHFAGQPTGAWAQQVPLKQEWASPQQHEVRQPAGYPHHHHHPIEPALSVGSMVIPQLHNLPVPPAEMAPMPADQLSWLASQL